MSEDDTHADDVPLDDYIDFLLALLASPEEGDDVGEVSGELGVALLERCSRDHNDADLALGIGHLTRALHLSADHENSGGWAFFLGIAYAGRADITGEPADRQRSIDNLRAAYVSEPGEADAMLTLSTLAQQLWRRHWALACQPSADEAAEVADLDHIIAEMDGWTLAPATLADAVAEIEMIRGLARLERHDHTSRHEDLDQGIALIAKAIGQLADDVDGRDYAAVTLIDAYRMRAERDGASADLDTAIAHGQAVLAGLDPQSAEWSMANCYLGMAHVARGEQNGDSADLDLAITHGRAALSAGWDGIAWSLGDWLRERAARNQSIDDVDEAIRLLGVTLADQRDAEGEWAALYDLGRAHRLRFQLGRDQAAIAESLRCLDRALAMVPTDEPDHVFLVHIERLGAGHDSISAQMNDDPATIRANAATHRAGIEAAHHALSTVRPSDADLRALLAGRLAFAEFCVFRADLVDPDVERAERAAELAKRLAGTGELSDLVAVVETVIGQWKDNVSDHRSGDAGVTPLASTLARGAFAGTELADELHAMLELTALGRAIRNRDERAFAGARKRIGRRLGPTAPKRDADPDDALLAVFLDMADAALHSDQARMVAISVESADILRASAADPMAAIIRQILDVTRVMAGFPPDATLDAAAGGRFGPGQTETSVYAGNIAEINKATSTVAGLLWAETRGDMPELRKAAWELDAMVGQTSAGRAVSQVVCLSYAAFGLRRLCERDSFDVRARHAATRRHEELLALLGGPDHLMWATAAIGLADCLRLAGPSHADRARELGKSALAARAWNVSLQNGADHAIQAAAAVADDIYKIAWWCVSDRAHEDLIAVLDAGRGLALRAAAMSRDIAAALDRIGEHGLAAEWRDSRGRGRDVLTNAILPLQFDASETPDDLRHRVLRALGADTFPEHTRIADIRAGLAAVEADAFIYLVPARAGIGGYAVVVPAAGEVRVLPLPRLVVDERSVIGRHVAAGRAEAERGASRDIEPERRDHLAPSVDDLCRWAWDAAVGEIIRLIRGWRLGRPARVVAVPMGVLALAPWHAARSADGDGRRYALDDLMISYSVSARMFCDAARQPIVESDVALVVGDPTGDLRFAAVEAQAIHQRFYGGIGEYFGLPADVASAVGTPEQVLDWIAGHAAATSTLHFACHGRIDPDDAAGAHLLLSGRRALSARELLDACAVAELRIDRVFLAACTTNTVGNDYDEAFSLVSVFRSAGAHTVFGSLWPVPDEDTSLLMFMVHHMLNVERLAPADALRQAQLWMLDPDRKPPATMPDGLKAYARRAEACDPVAWAGFTHMGR